MLSFTVAFAFVLRQEISGLPNESARELQPDVVAIYRAVVVDRLADAQQGSNYLVVANKTVPFCHDAQYAKVECMWPSLERILDPKVMPAIPMLLKQHLAKINDRPFTIPDLAINQARTADLSQIFQTTGIAWKKFYRRFPHSGGFLFFTLPAFTDDKSNAIVSISHSCGPKCGGGWLFCVSRAGDYWRVVGKWPLWVD